MMSSHHALQGQREGGAGPTLDLLLRSPLDVIYCNKSTWESQQVTNTPKPVKPEHNPTTGPEN